MSSQLDDREDTGGDILEGVDGELPPLLDVEADETTLFSELAGELGDAEVEAVPGLDAEEDPGAEICQEASGTLTESPRRPERTETHRERDERAACSGATLPIR